MSYAKRTITKLLDQAGIKVDGPEAHDIRVVNEAFYGRVFRLASLGLGESFMDGWWECKQLDAFFNRLIYSLDSGKIKLPWTTLGSMAIMRLLTLPARYNPFAIGKRHYDKGDDLFEAMLDERMVYSCAYWAKATSLNQAQEAKLDRVCRKLKLKTGMRVLDIGCGWGSFAKFASEKFGVSVVGITVSQEQVEYARKLCAHLPQVEIRYQDYREVTEQFDRIVSIGMFEHVRCWYYKTFMKCVRRCLKPDGLFLLHTIGGNKSAWGVDPWIDRYIFPGGMIPSMLQINRAAEGQLNLEHCQNIGPFYDPTLMAWHANFMKAWSNLEERYRDLVGGRFFRMWRYYLLSCAGAFRCGHLRVWQIVYSRGDNKEVYAFEE